jgi:hypothetical protein
MAISFLDWFIGIAGTLITAAVVWASARVMKASDTVIATKVEVKNLTKNLDNHRDEVIKAHEKIVDIFTGEIEPIGEEVKQHRSKLNEHGEKIVRIETHLKLK